MNILAGVPERALKADQNGYVHLMLRKTKGFDMETITDLQMQSTFVTMEGTT